MKSCFSLIVILFSSLTVYAGTEFGLRENESLKWQGLEIIVPIRSVYTLHPLEIQSYRVQKYWLRASWENIPTDSLKDSSRVLADFTGKKEWEVISFREQKVFRLNAAESVNGYDIRKIVYLIPRDKNTLYLYINVLESEQDLISFFLGPEQFLKFVPES